MGEIKKFAVILTLTRQTGYDSFQDYQIVKLFEFTNTFEQIFEWAKTQKKDVTIDQIKIADLTL